MNAMQWLLLILVVAAVVGVYFYLRRQAGDDPWTGMEESGETPETKSGESPEGDSYVVGVRKTGQSGARANGGQAQDRRTFSTDSASAAGSAPRSNIRANKPSGGVEQIFVLHVASRGETLFSGPDIHTALQEQKLQFGLNNVYHRISENNGVPESVYAVANMLKPGFLEPEEQDHLRTPGLTMILQLPGPVEGGVAVRDMLDTADAIAQRLGAEVLDDKRSLLKAQTAQFMLDEVAELDRKRRLLNQR